ncbi:MAG: histidine--tRNA ligase [Candidatus Pacebacteria bacterium]|nr:histidine--tRNA ligase [Candidatus Paceibacterota bacterium]
MEQKKLTTENYKGTRDFYPEDMVIRKYLFDVMRRTVEKYGYVEYDASIIEETDLYRAKSGEEIINEQTYTFQDRGGRDVTIRPEMTPTVARMIAKKRKELTFPLRWYSIPNLMRYERPQRGRVREHRQLNVDMFGIDSVSADIEIISVAYDIMSAFGAKDESFQIKINDRRIVNFLLGDFLGMDNERVLSLSKLIDKKAKMSEVEFKNNAKNILGDKIDLFRDILNNTDINDLPKEFEENEGVRDLKKLLKDLNDIGIVNVVYDPTIMRGFDYYTGMVFEIFDNGPENNRALFGGGRYDDLVGIFNVEKVCGVGFGMGDVTLQDYLETYYLLPENLRSSTDLYICVCAKEYKKDANILARYLRDNGINVAVDITDRKIPAQIKTADKKKIPFIVCVGENEVKSGQYKLKELSKGEEKMVGKEEIVQAILEIK